MSGVTRPVAVTGGSGLGPVPVFGYGPRPPTRAEKYERLAFGFCRLGTAGLIAWVLGPAWFVLIVATIAIGLYVKAMSVGVSWTQCLLRKPSLVIAFWGLVAVLDAYWLFALGGRAVV
jgi:hypothetical protein